jgi:hypothetical protein
MTFKEAISKVKIGNFRLGSSARHQLPKETIKELKKETTTTTFMLFKPYM